MRSVSRRAAHQLLVLQNKPINHLWYSSSYWLKIERYTALFHLERENVERMYKTNDVI